MQYHIALDTDARQIFGHVPVLLRLLTDVDSKPCMCSLDVVLLEQCIVDFMGVSSTFKSSVQ